MGKSAAEIIAQAEESIFEKVLSSAKSADFLFKLGKVSSGSQFLSKGFSRAADLSNEEIQVSALNVLATIYNDNRSAVQKCGLDLG